jgi:hypothetical protein
MSAVEKGLSEKDSANDHDQNRENGRDLGQIMTLQIVAIPYNTAPAPYLYRLPDRSIS